MIYTTKEYSLHFWADVKDRLNAEFYRRADQLHALLEPRETSFEDAGVTLERVAEDREKLFELMDELESLKLVELEVAQVTAETTETSGLAQIARQASILNDLIAVYPSFDDVLPDGIRAETDIQAAADKFAALANAGSGELANAERQRLKALLFPVMVVGQEENEILHKRLQELVTTRDELKETAAELLGTKVAFSVPETEGWVLDFLGLQYTLLDEEDDADDEQEEATEEQEGDAEPVADESATDTEAPVEAKAAADTDVEVTVETEAEAAKG